MEIKALRYLSLLAALESEHSPNFPDIGRETLGRICALLLIHAGMSRSTLGTKMAPSYKTPQGTLGNQ